MPIRAHCKWLIYMGQDRSGPYCAAGMRAASRQVHIATKHRDARGLLWSRQVDELGIGQANLVRAEMRGHGGVLPSIGEQRLRPERSKPVTPVVVNLYF
jgi:hypothetical protein